jgi:hypothetical protein
MSILTNFKTGDMKIWHYREINDDAELVMLSIYVIDLCEETVNFNTVFL